MSYIYMLPVELISIRNKAMDKIALYLINNGSLWRYLLMRVVHSVKARVHLHRFPFCGAEGWRSLT